MITFYGASDDLVEVEGCVGADEFNVYSSDKVHWRADLIAPDGGERMRVHAIYDGCWHFALGQVDEAVPFPAWGNGIGQRADVAYSVELRVDAPEGTRLRNIWPPITDD
jgi:hypothetical protein